MNIEQTRESMFLDLLNACLTTTTKNSAVLQNVPQTMQAKQKKVCRRIYLARVGLYKYLRDLEGKLPNASGVESAHQKAMETQMPQKERERKLEAFEKIMRDINGHDDSEESEFEIREQKY